jgi:ADP-heptose:LPS heptosyltransferase
MRVVVIFPGALGDCCILAAALARLRACGVAVELSVQRRLMPVAATLLADVPLGPPVDGAVVSSLFGEVPAPDMRAWLRGADRVHAWLARSEVAHRLRAHLADASGSAVVQLHAVPRDDGARHVLDEYLAALDAAALPPAPFARRAPPSTVWRAECGLRLLVHPGAGARAKCWPSEGFRMVADAWAVGGGETLVLLGPAEADDAAYWAATGHRVLHDVALGDVAAVVADATRFVGNDSGISHLAGALARRGVVLFGPTRPERWQPIGGTLVSVRFSDRPLRDVVNDVVTVLAPRTRLLP